MKKTTKMAIIAACSFVNTYCYSLFVFWIGGGEFKRGVEMGEALVFCTAVAIAAALISCMITTQLIEEDK